MVHPCCVQTFAHISHFLHPISDCDLLLRAMHLPAAGHKHFSLSHGSCQLPSHLLWFPPEWLLPVFYVKVTSAECRRPWLIFSLRAILADNTSLAPTGQWLLREKCVRLPRWLRGKESACQSRRLRRHGFDLWSGKIPRAAEQLSLWAAVIEPICGLEAGSHDYRTHVPNLWDPYALSSVLHRQKSINQ